MSCKTAFPQRGVLETWQCQAEVAYFSAVAKKSRDKKSKLAQVQAWVKQFGIPAWLLNQYALVGLVFVVYMLFFDAYNVFERGNLVSELHQARQDRLYYEQQIEVTKQRLDELMLDAETAEKFAREQYLMKREDEDIFVILDPSAAPKD